MLHNQSGHFRGSSHTSPASQDGAGAARPEPPGGRGGARGSWAPMQTAAPRGMPRGARGLGRQLVITLRHTTRQRGHSGERKCVSRAGAGRGGDREVCHQLSHVTGTEWPCPGTRGCCSPGREAACLRSTRPATAPAEARGAEAARPQAPSPAPCATSQVTETGTTRPVPFSQTLRHARPAGACDGRELLPVTCRTAETRPRGAAVRPGAVGVTWGAGVGPAGSRCVCSKRTCSRFLGG